MIRVALCITENHDFRLVVLALLVCAIGSTAAVQLFARIRLATGQSRMGWTALSAVAFGTMVWSTHFVAMMAFRTGVPVTLDPWLTLASLLVAIVLATPGLTVAARGGRSCALVGGGIVGIAIACMHYLGMAAYRVDGIVTWDAVYVFVSVLLSIAFSASAFLALSGRGRRKGLQAAGLLSLGVAGLHFTGMAAMNIAVLKLGEGLTHGAMTVLAASTAVASLIIVGCAAVSALIDGHTQTDTYNRLRRMALHDGLTDLPNRMSFDEELRRRLASEDRWPFMAVVMLDLSRFKVVNDTYGHHAGDQLLMALAARFAGMLRDGECIARLGGDEFAALVSYQEADDLELFLSRLTNVFATPFVFERFTAAIGANIGVAQAMIDGRDADTLLACADLAMYRAKSAHSSQPCYYDPTMDDAVRSHRELTSDLRDAIRSGAFELHFQVQASIDSGAIVGYEALLRWEHPTHGAIPPSVFIPLAEESGDIVPLSIWVLRQACFEAALWRNRHVVSVNLSPMHLSDPLLIDTVRSALTDSGLDAERLTLELTESAIIRDRVFALDQLRALKAMGIAIALDDFGVGYSSLDVLRSFPFDRIKLDASFVAEIEHDEQAVSILRSVAALGVTLGMPVLAEGIEEEAQLAIVAREGCVAVQGYLIGRPSRILVDPGAVRRIVLGSACGITVEKAAA